MCRFRDARASKALVGPVALCLLAACNPGPVPVPDLANPTGVAPELVRRVADVRAHILEEPGAAAGWRELGMLFDANGLFEEAAATYGKWVAIEPDEPRAWYHQARMSAELSRAEDALASFDRALELAESYAPAHWRRAEVLFVLDRVPEARAAFEAALARSRGMVAGQLGLARLHLSESDPQAALAILDPLIESHPRERFAHGLRARALRQLGQDGPATSALRREERSNETSLADPWFAEVLQHAVGISAVVDRASAALAGGDFTNAIALLEPLLARRPLELAVGLLAARALTRADRAAEALSLLEELERESGRHYRLELGIGRALESLGRTDEALVRLTLATEIHPRFAEAWTTRGEAEYRLGRLKAARASFERALEEGDRPVRDWVLLGRAQLGDDDPEAAERTIRAALEEYSNAATLWAYLAEAQAEAGRLDEARESLSVAQSRNPDCERIGPVRRRIRELEASEEKP